MSLIDPATLTEPWVLSEEKEKHPVSIPPNALKSFGRQDVVVLDFLYRSYVHQLKGVILNEEEDFNPQLQVSSFMGALYKSLKNKFLVLVLCPDDLIIKWHYYMSQCSNWEVKIIKPNMFSAVPEDFDQETGIVLLLSFTNIKLAEYLREYDFFSVVIDRFDEVATKLIIRKLQGSFNIGVTSRNFYVDRHQKLQWTMLNWTNPGCVRKLASFYEIDDDNFTNSRDNYKEWWFRLTWNFCDSFIKPSLEEKGNAISALKDWAKTHNLVANYQSNGKTKPGNRKRKGKASPEVKQEHVEGKDSPQDERPTKVYKKNAGPSKSLHITPSKKTNTKNKKNFRNLDLSSDSSDFSDTVIYENEFDANLEGDAMDAEDAEEPPIGGPMEENDNSDSGEELLCSLVRTKDKKSPRTTKSVTKQECHVASDDCDEADLFLKSVATTSNSLLPVKHRKNAEEFFNKILDQSEVKPDLFTRMEIELSEKDVLDPPSESDSFFKGMFSNSKSDRNEVRESECSNVSSNGIDVDTLVAEVMEMVGKK